MSTMLPADRDHAIAVVVESSLFPAIEPWIEQYADDLERSGKRARVISWAPGSASALRNLITQQIDEYGVDGAWLIGNLPAAWYQQ